MGGLKLVMVFVVLMIASFQLQSAFAQTRHVVGGDFGWNVPPSGNVTYTTWAEGETFNVGDSLLFNFSTGAHDVAEVSPAAYGPCTLANPISTTTTGPATINLMTPGNHYYVCTFGVHCQLGQKLTINVVASGSTAPTPTSPTPPSTMPSPTPPSPRSSSSSLAAVVPVTFLAAALAFFY